MRRRGDHYECTLCGAVIDLPNSVSPVTMIAAASGKPNLRQVFAAGVKVHECEIGLETLEARQAAEAAPPEPAPRHLG